MRNSKGKRYSRSFSLFQNHMITILVPCMLQLMRPVRLHLIRKLRKHSQWHQTHPTSSAIFGSFHFSKTYRSSKLPASSHAKSSLRGFYTNLEMENSTKNSFWFSFMSTEWGKEYCALLPAHILWVSLSFIVDKFSGFLTLCCLSDALTNSKLFEITFQMGNCIHFSFGNSWLLPYWLQKRIFLKVANFVSIASEILFYTLKRIQGTEFKM